jgi:hypothetical protein
VNEVHLGKRPFVCNFEGCDAAFARNSNLNTHFRFYHTAEGQKERKREEVRIAKVLTAAGIDFKRELHVRFDCWGGTFCRVDFVFVMNGKVIVIEVDEYQHDAYGVACEVTRMSDMYTAWRLEGNTMPACILRYNPHTFTIDGKTAKVTRKEREARLVKEARAAAARESDGLQIQYLYYDVVEGDNKIWADEGYPAAMKACCLPPISNA